LQVGHGRLGLNLVQDAIYMIKSLLQAGCPQDFALYRRQSLRESVG
jgi:hypothetical protein